MFKINGSWIYVVLKDILETIPCLFRNGIRFKNSVKKIIRNCAIDPLKNNSIQRGPTFKGCDGWGLCFFISGRRGWWRFCYMIDDLKGPTIDLNNSAHDEYWLFSISRMMGMKFLILLTVFAGWYLVSAMEWEWGFETGEEWRGRREQEEDNGRIPWNDVNLDVFSLNNDYL